MKMNIAIHKQTSSFKSAEPKLSVLMPVYNAMPYLVDAVESILSQTHSNFEFLIIDDGSTDSSLDVLEKYADKDDRIQLISRENKGIVATRNELLDLARGKYFAIMDSDDISYPERLDKQLAFLLNHADYGIVGCRDMLIDPEGLPIRIINDNSEHDDVDTANLSFDVFQTLNGYMAETDKVKAVGGYRDEIPYAEDRDVFLRMAEVGKIKVIPEVLYAYRQHYTNTCVVKRHEISQYVMRVVQDAYERRGIPFSNQEPSLDQDISLVQQYQVWAWWALAAGHIKTARKYAKKIIMKEPLGISNWRLLLCTLRGY